MSPLNFFFAQKFGLAFLVATLTFSSCKIVDPQEESPLLNTRWTLVNSVDLDGRAEGVRPGDFTFILDPVGTFEGNALCNECGGRYNLVGQDSLEINGGCTEIGCLAWPRYRNSGFPYGMSFFEIIDNELHLTSNGGASTFIYRPL